MIIRYAKSEHEKTFEELFGDNIFVRHDGRAIPCIILAFVNRSGSNYLAELLRSTGRFAGFGECLNAPNVKYLAPRYGVNSLEGYLSRHRQEDVKSSGQMWGLKAGWMQLAMLLRTGAIPKLLQPTLVSIRRRDLIGQAISLFIAEQTLQWKSTEDAVSAREKVAYDGNAILAHFRGLAESYVKVEQVVALSNCPYQQIYYEDLMDSPQSTIAKLTGALVGNELSPLLDAVQIKIQRDEVSEKFKLRFLAEMQQIKWDVL